MAVDQNQRSGSAKSTKVDGCDSSRAGAHECALGRIDLGELIEEVFGARGADPDIVLY